jgi:ABC-type glycerol-3-phosphate transport system permease component
MKRSEVSHSSVRTTRLFKSLLLYFLLVVVTVVALTPTLWMLSTSFKKQHEIFQTEVNWIPHEFTAENYSKAFELFPLWMWFRNSILVAVLTLMLTLACDIMAAYAFSKLNFKGRNLLFALVVASIMLPREAAIVPLYRLIRTMGMMDSWAAIILPQAAEAIGVFLLAQFFRNVPNELSESASLDGCGHWRILWRIVTPLSTPILAVLIILTLVNSWNNFLWPLIVATSEASVTLPVGLASVMSGSSEAAEARQFGLLMATAFISCLPTIAVFLVLQKQFIQSVTMTGLKY